MADLQVGVRGSYGRIRGVNDTPSPLIPPADDIVSGRVVAALDLCRRADITYRQLDYWVTTYDDPPIWIGAAGSGSNRWFRAVDIPKYHVLGRLTKMSMSIGRALMLTHQQRLRLCGRMRKLYRQAGESE